VAEAEAGAERDLRADDAVAAVKAMLDREHVHRAALALGNPRGTARQLGHDQLGIDTVSEHVAMIAVAGNHRILAHRQRGLQPDRHGFLADIEVAEAADQAEAVKLPRPLLEAADEQHLAVEFEHLPLVRLKTLRLGRALAVRRRCGGRRRTDRLCCPGQEFGSLMAFRERPIGRARAVPQRHPPSSADMRPQRVGMIYSSGRT
jgi:hypothetical protein